MLIALAAMPFYGFAVGVFVVKMLNPRYLLPTTIGVCALCALALDGLLRGRPAATSALVGACALAVVANLTYDLTVRSDRSNATTVLTLPAELQLSSLPIVVGQGVRYLPAMHYAAPGLEPRLHYVVDPEAALAFSGGNVVDRNFVLARDFLPIRADDRARFNDRHPRYLLAWEPGPGWLMTALKRVGAKMEGPYRAGVYQWYLVSSPVPGALNAEPRGDSPRDVRTGPARRTRGGSR